jgi:integrase
MGVTRYTGKRGVTYSIDYYASGERIREKVGPNKKEALELLGKRMKEIREGKLFGVKKRPEVLFEGFCDTYQQRTSHRRSGTFDYNLKMFKKHFAGKFLHAITEKDIDDYLILRRDMPTRWEKKRSGASVNRELNDLSPIFSLAVRMGMIEKNPASKARRLPEAKNRLRYLTLEEAATLLDLARKRRSKDIYLLVLMALDTGLRRGEMFNLKWEDIDYMQGQIWIRETKNATPRYAPMSDRVREELLRRPRRIDSDFIFPGRANGKTLSNGVREVFVDLCQRAGIKDFRFHDLRHTFASHLVMAGIPLHTVGELLGHKTPGMTMRYAHLSPEYLKRAVSSLPKWEADGQKTVRNEEVAV